MLSKYKKNIEPIVSQTATIFPYRLALILLIGFLWTLKTLISLKFDCSSPRNLIIPSEKPTTIILPLFLFENGSH